MKESNWNQSTANTHPSSYISEEGIVTIVNKDGTHTPAPSNKERKITRMGRQRRAEDLS